QLAALVVAEVLADRLLQLAGVAREVVGQQLHEGGALAVVVGFDELLYRLLGRGPEMLRGRRALLLGEGRHGERGEDKQGEGGRDLHGSSWVYGTPPTLPRPFRDLTVR